MFQIFIDRTRRCAREEDGVMIAFGLFVLIIVLMIGGFAIDYSNAIRERTKLQTNADATAHAALVSREFNDPSASISDAMSVAYANMPKSMSGDIVHTSDIVFGTWDPSSRTFSANSTSRKAVRVTMHEDSTNQNPVSTYLLKLVGLNYWDIRVQSTFTTYYRRCMSQGFVGQYAVDLQSNNTYKNGFCIHSNDIVSLNSNNYFESGTHVTMPDPSTIQLPSSGFSTDPGLQAALQDDAWHIRILDQIDTIMSDLLQGSTRYTPSYITNTTPITYTQGKIGNGDLSPGSIYTASCSGNSPLNISSGTTLSKVVIVTNCLINFGSNVQLHDVVIASTSTNAKAVTGAAGLQVGLNDNCAAGGGAQILTDGGMDFPSSMALYGGQLIAKGDVNFSADGNGVDGASIISGGTVSGTSNMTMAYCDPGNEGFQAEYFRMVQ